MGNVVNKKLMEKEGFELEYWLKYKEYYIYHRGCGNFPWQSRYIRTKICKCEKKIPKELLFTAEMLGWEHKYVERREKL